MRDRLTILVIVGTRADEHSLRNQMGIGSESDCLLGQMDSILWTSDSEAGTKTEKLVGVAGRECECGDDVAGLLVRERRGLEDRMSLWYWLRRDLKEDQLSAE